MQCSQSERGLDGQFALLILTVMFKKTKTDAIWYCIEAENCSFCKMSE